MRKKYCGIALMMAAVMAVSGCAGNASNPDNNAEENTGVSDSGNAAVNDAEMNSETEPSVTEGEESPEADKIKDVENSEGATDDIQVPVIEISQKELPDSEAVAFVQNMKTGWNLGNTFDAVDSGVTGDDLKYESVWCGTVTTKEMIDTLKEAGFRTIRIPVSWHNHLTDDKHTINEAWLNRVREVVDYAIDDGMYVIINIHHDFSKDYIYPTGEYLEQSETYVTDIWTQVADRFKDYDEHLIMESMNEPRMVGSNNEWWLDLQSEECIDSIRCINEINQTFVDVVRSSGGNNATRYLMVPGYDASLQGAVNEYFSLPGDIEGNQNKILVSVHAYTPYSFALQAVGESGSMDTFDMSSSSSTKDIDDLMKQLYDTYVKNGTGVVIGEYGAREKNSNLQARVDFTAYYIEAARASGITCCIWDNNSFTGSGENFGLFERQSSTFLYPEILESIMAHCE